MTKLRSYLLLLVMLTLVFATRTVLAADVGPKPTMDFDFQTDSSVGEVTITSGVLYECQQVDCSNATLLEEVGPQRFTCEELSCSAMGYGFAPYHRIEIGFSDGKTRQSNIFETVDFDSRYRVTINSDDLTVEAVSGSPAPTSEPFPTEPSSTPLPRVLLGVGGLLCMCLVFLLIAGVVIFFVLRSRKK
jgi:hypothetical protein